MKVTFEHKAKYKDVCDSLFLEDDWYVGFADDGNELFRVPADQYTLIGVREKWNSQGKN